MNLLGWLGAACLGLCGLPQAIKTVRTKKTDDVSGWFLFLWLAGELLTLAYVAPKLDWPLLANYCLNIAVICVILRYKFKEGS